MKTKKGIIVGLMISLFVLVISNKVYAASCRSGETSQCIVQQYKVQNANDTANIQQNVELCTTQSNSNYTYYAILQGTNCGTGQFLCCGEPVSQSSSTTATNSCASGETSECMQQVYNVQNANDTVDIQKNGQLCSDKSNETYSYYPIFSGTSCGTRQFLCCGQSIAPATSGNSSSATTCVNNGDPCVDSSGQNGACANGVCWGGWTPANTGGTNCTQAGACQGENTGDSCQLSNGTTGTCNQLTGSMYSAGGYCACTASSANSSSLLPDGATCAGNATCQSGQCLADSNGNFVCSSGTTSASGSCTTGYEADDGTCYQTQAEYCDAVDDATICGDSANTTSTAKLPFPTTDRQNGNSSGSQTPNSNIGSGLSQYFPTTGQSGGNTSSATGALAANGCPDANYARLNGTGVCAPISTGLSSATLSQILTSLLNWILGIFTTLAILAFVISGVQYLTSTGNEDMIETAKRNAKCSIIGIVVGLSGFVVLQAVASLISGTSQFF